MNTRHCLVLQNFRSTALAIPKKQAKGSADVAFRAAMDAAVGLRIVPLGLLERRLAIGEVAKNPLIGVVRKGPAYQHIVDLVVAIGLGTLVDTVIWHGLPVLVKGSCLIWDGEGVTSENPTSNEPIPGPQTQALVVGYRPLSERHFMPGK